MLFQTKIAFAPPLSPMRSLLAFGALMLLSGCFPGAAEQDQGVIVADIAGETEDE